MSIFRVIYIFFISILPLNAIVQEDAEDKSTSRWEIIFSPTKAYIENFYDRLKKSRVIHFKGDGVKSIYKFKTIKKEDLKKKKIHEYFLSWDMKYKKDFVIILVIQTTQGKSYLIYTSGNHNSYHQIGLGDEVIDGKWHTIKRNLQEDLGYFDNRQQFLSIKTFVIKGDGSIDNLKTEVKVVGKSKKKKKPKSTKIKLEHNSLPVIKIKGANPLHLDIGENYTEAGVEAYDKEDGQVEVNSIEDINSDEEGTYMVMYIARDSHGDVSLDRRVVIVGRGSSHQKRVKVVGNKKNIASLDKQKIDKREYY